MIRESTLKPANAPYVVTTVRRVFGEGTLQFSMANERLEKKKAVLASNAETAIAFVTGKTGKEDSLVTRTAAIYHLRKGHRFIAFDDDQQDNALIELDYILDDQINRLVHERTSVVRRQLERAYDTNRVICIDGKESMQTKVTKNRNGSSYTSTSFNNNRFIRSTRPTSSEGSAFSRDKRYIAFFGDEQIAQQFSRFAFERQSLQVPLYVADFSDLIRERRTVQIRGCEIYSVKEGVTYLRADAGHFSDGSAGLGIRKKVV